MFRHIIATKSQGFTQTPQDIMEKYNGCSVPSTLPSEQTDPLNPLQSGFQSWMGIRANPCNSSESISRWFSLGNCLKRVIAKDAFLNNLILLSKFYMKLGPHHFDLHTWLAKTKDSTLFQ